MHPSQNVDTIISIQTAPKPVKTQVWFGQRLQRLRFGSEAFQLFFFFSSTRVSAGDKSYYSHCAVTTHALFSHFFIKNGSYGTIHTFKNYFAIVFLIFSKNKLYPNGPLFFFFLFFYKQNFLSSLEPIPLIFVKFKSILNLSIYFILFCLNQINVKLFNVKFFFFFYKIEFLL